METREMLVQGTRGKAFCEWFKSFREGKETTEIEPRSCCPSTRRTPEIIAKVRQMLASDRRLTLRLFAEELGIWQEYGAHHRPRLLGKRKIWFRFVPHKLIDKQKAKQMETSGDFISMCDEDPLLLENIVTGDETWCYQFNPEQIGN